MKSSLKLLSTSISSVIALGFLAGASNTVHALTWDGGSAVWNNTNLNWNGGTAAWDGTTAVFQNTGAATVTIGSDLSIGALDFSTVGSGPYTFSNTAHTMTFTGAGISNSGGTANVQVLSGNGTIIFNSGSSAGDSSISVSTTGALSFNGTSSAGTAVITNSNDLNFNNSSTASNSVIDNTGNLFFNDTSSTGVGSTASISNGGTIDITNHTGTVKIGSLNNVSGGLAGLVVLGQNKLQLSGGLTLANVAQNGLDFTIATPSTSGTIFINPGNFITSLGTGLVDITFTSAGPAVAGTYTLIDWTGSTNNGVDLSDFNLVGPLPEGLNPATHLAIVGSQLQLVAVPEPSSLIMPMAGVLGMVWLRRRATRVVA
jgi:hypothetical protein